MNSICNYKSLKLGNLRTTQEIRLLSYWESLAFLNTETLANISTPRKSKNSQIHVYKSSLQNITEIAFLGFHQPRADRMRTRRPASPKFPRFPFSFPSWSILAERTDGTAAIIFTAACVRRQRPRTAIVGLRNERQFLQGRTMCRISALCWPVPPVLSRDTAIS